MAQLLRETAAVDHTVCEGPLEAEVLEVRLIAEWSPRFNRHGTRTASYRYLKLTTGERFPRLSVVRVVRDDGGVYLGPLPSTRFARRVAEAVETAVPLRRCTASPPVSGSATAGGRAPCAPAQLGVATCPCAGHVGEQEYRQLAERARRGLTAEPDLLLAPLALRMASLARQQRFEEAADVRDRAAALSRAIDRQRRIDGLRRCGHLVIETPTGGAELRGGRLVRSWAGPAPPPALDLGAGPAPPPVIGPGEVDELLVVARWLDERADQARIVHADVGLASPLPRIRSFLPGRRGPRPPGGRLHR